MTVDRAERIGFNEAVFRDVNERIDELQGEFGRAGTMEIVCECGDDRCMGRIAITPQAYRDVRADPTLFVILVGHDEPDVEDVVGQGEGYVLVRKRPGTPARIAEETA